jgi:AcrR family transcriptional regulator
MLICAVSSRRVHSPGRSAHRCLIKAKCIVMNARGGKRPRRSLMLWDRPEPESRPPPSPLSRERIVRAAIALADKHGLASVSLRKVGASLNAGPMRLYGYLSTKDELLELMVDAVYGEMTPIPISHRNWRDSLKSIAHLTRHAAMEHRWFIDLLGGRPHLGPNALAHLEASLSAFSGTSGVSDIDSALRFIAVLNAYVLGAMRREIGELREEVKSGKDKNEWQRAHYPYMTRMIATGKFPNLARVMREGEPRRADIEFDKGLTCVLDGIGIQFQHRAVNRRRLPKSNNRRGAAAS